MQLAEAQSAHCTVYSRHNPNPSLDYRVRETGSIEPIALLTVYPDSHR